MIEESINAYREVIRRDPDSLEGHVALAEMLGEIGDQNEANELANKIIRIDPEFSTKKYVENLAYRDSAELVRFSEGLLKAGLPD